MYHLPLELVREVTRQLFYLNDRSDIDIVFDRANNTTSKPEWSLFCSLSMASRSYRSIALETWFSRLRTENAHDMAYIADHFSQVALWVRWANTTLRFFLADICMWKREMHIINDPGQTWDLILFQKLHKLRIDYLSTETYLFATNVPNTIRELDIRNVFWPGPREWESIMNAFVGIRLRVMRMAQPYIWCSLCNTCGVADVENTGAKTIVYEGGRGLPVRPSQPQAFANCLKSSNVCSKDITIYFPGSNIFEPSI